MLQAVLFNMWFWNGCPPLLQVCNKIRLEIEFGNFYSSLSSNFMSVEPNNKKIS